MGMCLGPRTIRIRPWIREKEEGERNEEGGKRMEGKERGRKEEKGRKNLLSEEARYNF